MEQVTLKGSVPEIKAIWFNGARYVCAEDVVKWFLYLADNLIDQEETDPDVVDGQALLAEQIRLLATFTTERAEACAVRVVV